MDKVIEFDSYVYGLSDTYRKAVHELLDGEAREDCSRVARSTLMMQGAASFFLLGKMVNPYSLKKFVEDAICSYGDHYVYEKDGHAVVSFGQAWDEAHIHQLEARIDRQMQSVKNCGKVLSFSEPRHKEGRTEITVELLDPAVLERMAREEEP